MQHARRHLPDDERERREAEPAPVAPAPAPGSTESVLQLQRTAGNQAVGAMLARTPPPAAAPAKTDAELFDDAVKANDWEKAAESLVKLDFSAMPAKLTPLTVDQLRLLQDGLIRGALGITGALRAVMAQYLIVTELGNKGVVAGKVMPGTAFGTLEAKVHEKTNGNKTTGANYAYWIELTFTPDAAAVKADEIAFIQSVRLVDTATGANKDPEETNKKRQTGTATSVDRLGGMEQGWYGMKDDQTAGGNLKTWKKGDPTKPAWMKDRPSWNVANTTWQFETSVVAKSGTDAGKVYATMTWGFTVDNDLKITELPQIITNKQSKEFTSAVDKWNAQAAGPAADRNAPGQKSLPALK